MRDAILYLADNTIFVTWAGAKFNKKKTKGLTQVDHVDRVVLLGNWKRGEWDRKHALSLPVSLARPRDLQQLREKTREKNYVMVQIDVAVSQARSFPKRGSQLAFRGQ